MRLHIRVLGAEELLCALNGESLYLVDIFASAVVAGTGVTFGVLVGQMAPHCLHDSFADKVFGSN